MPDMTMARVGDFLLVHDESIEAVAIHLATGGRWNHVACVAGDHLVEALGTGTMRTALDAYANADAVLVTVPLTDGQREMAGHWLDTAVGAKYDYADIASFAANLFLHGRFVLGEDGKYICSVLEASALKVVGYPVPVDVHRIAPNDMARWFGVAT